MGEVPEQLANDVIRRGQDLPHQGRSREPRHRGTVDGRAQTFYIAFNHIDLFLYVGVFSAGLPTIPGISVPIPCAARGSAARPHITRSVDPERFLALTPQLNSIANARLRLLYVHCGAEDADHGPQPDQGPVKVRGITTTVIETHGYGHEWPFWRVTLEDYAPRLFQAAAK